MKCPDRGVLIKYAEGNMANSEQKEQIKKHIESCQKCQNLLRSYIMFQKEGHDANPEKHSPHEIHVSGENEGIIEEYEAEFEEKFSDRQIRNIKIAGIALTLLAMTTIFGIFIWQTRHNEMSINIADIEGVRYRIWINENFSVKQAFEDINDIPALQDMDNYLVFLTPGLSKVLYKPRMNDAFWYELTGLLKEQNVSIPAKMEMLLIESELFSDMESAKGSLTVDISIYFCKNRVMIIQRARY